MIRRPAPARGFRQRSRMVALLLFYGLGATARQGAAAPPLRVQLRNATWRILLDPQRLAVSAQPAGRREAQVSAPQAGLGPVIHFEHTARQARWELPARRLTVSVRLEGAALLVSLKSSGVGEFTWPVIEPQAAIRGYILPTFEGRYVPAHDPEWSRYLADQG